MVRRNKAHVAFWYLSCHMISLCDEAPSALFLVSYKEPLALCPCCMSRWDCCLISENSRNTKRIPGHQLNQFTFIWSIKLKNTFKHTTSLITLFMVHIIGKVGIRMISIRLRRDLSVQLQQLLALLIVTNVMNCEGVFVQMESVWQCSIVLQYKCPYNRINSIFMKCIEAYIFLNATIYKSFELENSI